MKFFCYKLKIRKEISKIRRTSSLTYQQLALSIGVEPSYLSRFLSNSDVHFSDELLFKLLTALKLDWTNIDTILLLKEYDRTENPERKKFLLTRMRLGRINRWKQNIKKIKEELNEVVSVLTTVE